MCETSLMRKVLSNEPLKYIFSYLFLQHFKHNVHLTFMKTFMKPFLEHNSTWKSKSRLKYMSVWFYRLYKT